MPAHHIYQLFGFRLRSTLRFPELTEVMATTGCPDVELAQVSTPIADRVCVNVSAIGANPLAKVEVQQEHYGLRIVDGREVAVWAATAAGLQDARSVLLGRGIALLSCQRKMWPLHVSAVGSTTGAWLFSGQSGAGKSTLALYLHVRHGLAHISDDLAIVRHGDSEFLLSPSLGYSRVTPEALNSVFDEEDRTGRAIEQDTDDKWRFPVNLAGPVGAAPVRGLVILSEQDGGRASMSRLTGADAVTAIRKAVYNPIDGYSTRTAAETLRFCVDFVNRVPVYQFSRRKSCAEFGTELRPLLDAMN
ncbi:MAG: hypothetical protein KDI71_11060, partial [Xanthomonadales bacterium]|nr:hypothetical protein [Xanthomonadales bacterium]